MLATMNGASLSFFASFVSLQGQDADDGLLLSSLQSSATPSTLGCVPPPSSRTSPTRALTLSLAPPAVPGRLLPHDRRARLHAGLVPHGRLCAPHVHLHLRCAVLPAAGPAPSGRRRRRGRPGRALGGRGVLVREGARVVKHEAARDGDDGRRRRQGRGEGGFVVEPGRRGELRILRARSSPCSSRSAGCLFLCLYLSACRPASQSVSLSLLAGSKRQLKLRLSQRNTSVVAPLEAAGCTEA